MATLVMGYWDCPICGTKEILGDVTNCPSCGRARGEVQFYMKGYTEGETREENERADIEYLDEEQAKYVSKNPDWYCSFCNSLNSDNAQFCGNCGASRADSESNYFEMLQKKKSEMELALQHRYTLTDVQKKVMIDEKDMILDGIEEWGSITGALSHNKKITSKASTIMSYCQQFPEFKQAIEISKAIFRDKVDATVVERAIEGTENPQFFKGECF